MQRAANISTPLTGKGSHTENKTSHGRKKRFLTNVLNSVVFYYMHLVQKAKFLCSTMSKQYSDVCFSSSFWKGGGEHAQKPKFGDEKKTS